MNVDEIDIYLREIGQFPLLGEEEERALADRVVAGDAEAREAMIRANLRLVVSIARRFGAPGLPLPDLIAEGNLGLLKAVDRYRPEMGHRFSTYASWWIRQTIRRALVSKGKNIRVPAYMTEIAGRWRATARALIQEKGRTVSAEEIAERLEVPPERMAGIRQALEAQYSSAFSGSHRGGDDGEEADLEEQLARAGRDSDGGHPIYDDADGEAKLAVMFDCLGARSAEIMRRRYGIGRAAPMTLEAIGADMEPPLTRERIRQIERIALETLKAILDEEEQRPTRRGRPS